MSGGLSYRPGVVLDNGKPIPVLVLAARRDDYIYTHSCLGHRLEGEEVHEMLRAAQAAIDAAALLVTEFRTISQGEAGDA